MPGYIHKDKKDLKYSIHPLTCLAKTDVVKFFSLIIASTTKQFGQLITVITIRSICTTPAGITKYGSRRQIT